MTDLVAAHLDHLRAAGYSQRTIKARADVLRRLHEALDLGLAFASTAEIEAWLGTDDWSRWTRHTYSGHIRGFYAWADGRYLDGDPTADMPVPPGSRCIPRPVTDDELRQALGSPYPWSMVVRLAAYAGLRVSEIARADREDATEQTLYVPTGKGGEPGTVPMHPYLWQAVAHLPPGPLVRHSRGGRVGGHWISTEARRHFLRIGLPGVHVHRFRHWYGTNVQARVGDLRVTQECLRHRNVSSTQAYTLVTGAQRSAAVVSLPVPGPSGANA